MLTIPSRNFVWPTVCLARLTSAHVIIFRHDTDFGNDDGHGHGHGCGHKNHGDHSSLHNDDEEQGLVFNCNRIRGLSIGLSFYISMAIFRRGTCALITQTYKKSLRFGRQERFIVVHAEKNILHAHTIIVGLTRASRDSNNYCFERKTSTDRPTDGVPSPLRPPKRP